MNKLFLALPLMPLSACASAQTPEKIVRHNFEPLTKQTANRRPNIVVGFITPEETKIFSVGTENTENHVYEIGSITKVFVGLLLAQAQADGKLKLDAKVRTHVPQLKTDITFYQLANHTSGLPRLPENLKSTDPLQPYINYDEQALFEFLKTFKTAPTGQSVYSNLGAGLSGYVLEKIYGKSLDALIREKITAPLIMNTTGIYLSPVPGYLNAEEVPAWKWDHSVLTGAGALKSTVSDMLLFLKWRMDGNSDTALFWQKLEGENIIWHNGGTYGASSFIGYNPDKKIAIAVLSNSMSVDEKGVNDDLDFAAIKSLLQMGKK